MKSTAKNTPGKEFDALRRLLPPSAEFFHYEETSSTNTRAKEYAKEHPDTPAVFLADGQTAGRGRLGRSFASPKGAGLYISFLLPGIMLRAQGCADPLTETARAAVLLAQSIESLCPGVSPQIKWVNDLLIGGKKIAGILTEGVIAEDGVLSALVVGIGVNLLPGAIPEELSGVAASLGDFVSPAAPPSAARLAEALIPRFFGEAIPWIAEYRRRLAYVGEAIELIPRHTEQGIRERATLLGVTDEGFLLVRAGSGEERVVSSGEISLRPADR